MRYKFPFIFITFYSIGKTLSRFSVAGFSYKIKNSGTETQPSIPEQMEIILNMKLHSENHDGFSDLIFHPLIELIIDLFQR